MSKRRKARTAPAALPGLTSGACASTCTAARCVISGQPYCAHPRQGGLRFSDMGNKAAMARLTAAAAQAK